MTEPQTDLTQLWPSVVSYLTDTQRAIEEHRQPLPKTSQRFLELVKPGTLAQGFAVFSVGNEGTRNYVESHLSQPIADALTHFLHTPTVVVISINPDEDPELEEEPDKQALFSGWSTTHTPRSHSQARATRKKPDNRPGDFSGDLDSSHHSRDMGRQAPTAQHVTTAQQAPTQPRRSQDSESYPTSHTSQAQQEAAPTDYASTNLSTKYTMENFVVGPSNRFASSAAASVAENPAKAYNPLFIYGGSGLGKTHLLQATGNYALQLFPHLKVCYISTESFVSGFIEALRFQRIDAFKQKYRALDMLIIDDIQFLQGRESTQEEFFHTFNTLYESGSQIVLSSDRRPEELTILEDRLRTRFQGGLITDVQPPDMESRIAILNKLAEADKLDIPADVIELVASRFDSSVRELNGAYKRVTAQASITHEPFSCELALEAIEALGGGKATVPITTELIMETVAEYFTVSIADIVGTKKSQPIAHARQMAMYLSRDLTDLSFPDIGKAFGGKHHSTVVHAHQKIGKDITNKETVYNDIQELTRLIKQA